MTESDAAEAAGFDRMLTLQERAALYREAERYPILRGQFHDRIHLTHRAQAIQVTGRGIHRFSRAVTFAYGASPTSHSPQDMTIRWRRFPRISV